MKKHNKRRRLAFKGNKGFSLVEIILFIVIVALVVIVVLIAALLILPQFIDVQTYKPKLEERISSMVGVPVTVAINNFVTDTTAEHEAIGEFCKALGVDCTISSHWEQGGDGGVGATRGGSFAAGS